MRFVDDRLSYICEWFGISEHDNERYQQAYPSLNLQDEFRRMEAWLEANPARRKKNVRRFIVNWLGKSQRAIELQWHRDEFKRREAARQAAVGTFRGRI
jgi:hypothetical protein